MRDCMLRDIACSSAATARPVASSHLAASVDPVETQCPVVMTRPVASSHLAASADPLEILCPVVMARPTVERSG